MKRHFLSRWMCLLFVLVAYQPATAATLVGKDAPEFALVSLPGPKVTLSKLRQQGQVLLVFWTTECLYCLSHIDDLNKMQAKHSTRLTVTAINIGGEVSREIRDYVKRNKIGYLILADRLNNIEVGDAYQVKGTPTMVLISAEGKVLYVGASVSKVSQWLDKS